MKYNIIGDIHCRSHWKNLVNDEYVNIFVGDYFSPYIVNPEDENVFKIGKQNFLDIIKYKEEHPETILLIGNHDEDHWHIREMYSRHDLIHCDEISNLFEKYKKYFQVAYSINDEVLVTHAGVSMIWYIHYKYNRWLNYPLDLNDITKAETIEEAVDIVNEEMSNEFIQRYYKEDRMIFLWHNAIYWYVNGKFEKFTVTPDKVADFVNELWKSGNYRAFNFRSNAHPNDGYGEDVHHGPMWIRPAQLQEANIFKYANYAQVVGHTQYDLPNTYYNGASRCMKVHSLNSIEEDKIFFCDCLGSSVSSVLYNSDSKIFTINNKK